jgi:hypothetical protein
MSEFAQPIDTAYRALRLEREEETPIAARSWPPPPATSPRASPPSASSGRAGRAHIHPIQKAVP